MSDKASGQHWCAVGGGCVQDWGAKRRAWIKLVHVHMEGTLAGGDQVHQVRIVAFS